MEKVLLTYLVLVLVGPQIARTTGETKWREDGRCGPDYLLSDGTPAQCNPDVEYSCCSPQGYCGRTPDHCLCQTCIDYKQCVDKADEDGLDYRGTVSVTVSGNVCQRWDSQSPNEHSATAERKPDSGLHENYCRNPDGESGAWCYNGEGTVPRWEYCDIPICAVDGGWSEFSEWSECSVACGGGRQSRSRSCSNPAPENGGADCDGGDRQSMDCNADPCPVDGGWSDFSDWSECSVACGGGRKSRSRSCSNPAPENGGADCDGGDLQSMDCNADPCPVDGGWSDFSDWSECSVACGGGRKSRSRSCSNPAPQNGGADCDGGDLQSMDCNADPCPLVDECVDKADEDGLDYRGTVSVTVSGNVCQRWDSQSPNEHIATAERKPDSGLQWNYCRNPDGSNGAWCYNGEGTVPRWEYCDIPICAIDGGWSEFSEWSECSVACGGGRQSRSRSCSNPAPENGGADCDGGDRQSMDCNADPCPVDGGWSDFSDWSECSVACGGGRKSRSRSCSNPAPENGGADCDGGDLQSMDCNADPCPVDGGWSDFSDWSECSVACGGGRKSRSRSCSNPAPQNGGADCDGGDLQSMDCNADPCPLVDECVDKADEDGLDYRGTVSVTVSGNVCQRWDSQSPNEHSATAERKPDSGLQWNYCRNPDGSNGAWCYNGEGTVPRWEYCDIPICAIDGGWSEFSEWSECSVACGGGRQSRSRSCSNPAPENGGADCDGGDRQSMDCNADPCPVDGGWSDFSDWSECSVACGGGRKSRSRSCSNPAPENGGADCDGGDLQSMDCNADPCPVDGGWSDFSDWSECSVACGGGRKSRSRSCSNPAPQNGGADCDGGDLQSMDCNADPCPLVDECVDKADEDGLDYRGTVSVTVSGNVCQRWDSQSPNVHIATAERKPDSGLHENYCRNPDGENGAWCYNGEGTVPRWEYCDIPICAVDGGWSEFSEWSECSVACGGGSQTRSRSCSNPAPENGGTDCDGGDLQSRDCNADPCPIDGGWSDFSDWSECSVACGGGSQSRSRSCSNPAPENGGTDCDGDDSQSQDCNADPCSVDGGWSAFSDWSECSVACGGGSQIRSRSCSNPAPENGGTDCDGDDLQSRDCNADPCPIDGGWSDFSDWSECSVACGGGSQSRSRSCSNPAPENGGTDCDGDDSQSQDCNADPCSVDGGWSAFSDWSECSVACGGGSQSRSRSCSNPAPENGGADCDGDDSESQDCNADPCLWRNDKRCGPEFPLADGSPSQCNPDHPKGAVCCSKWGRCSSVPRYCTCPTCVNYGRNCDGGPCPTVDGGWSEFGEWSECSVSCGGGSKFRSRSCSNPAPENGGADCDGDDLESQDCNADPCLWRDDNRCGSKFPLADGSTSQCNPDHPRGAVCCSKWGRCSSQKKWCTCSTCVNYGRK
ncbi:SCO-spondin-like isoform X2 [Bolinopsis microptera]